MSRYNGNTVDMSNYCQKLVEEANWPVTHTPKEGVWRIVYGFDYACGYFIQFFPTDDVSAKVALSKTGEEDGCVDLDSLFYGITGVKLGYYLKITGGNKSHMDSCYMDLPF